MLTPSYDYRVVVQVTFSDGHSKFPRSDLEEVDENAYTNGRGWLREAVPVLRPPASSGSGDYVPPPLLSRGTILFCRSRSMHGLSIALANFKEDVESVDLVLPFGVLLDPICATCCPCTTCPGHVLTPSCDSRVVVQLVAGFETGTFTYPLRTWKRSTKQLTTNGSKRGSS